ncbi:hypothetical protein CRYO30217_00953 [Parvicella tangerina]|uniref:PKD/Chitinase domain-containing protein n=2 Tax=Parvicella tangerina TaxID=2829795 RepID=A0A916JKJ7_9FLAO|nr:hypothetical protein CRYO30217_00953 [Parvicella tangerina]
MRLNQFIIFATLLLLKNALVYSQITVPANGCVSENFDNGNPWTFGGSNSSWTYANPNKLHIADDITGGGNCLILGGNTPTSTYNSNEDSWARSPVYDFSQVTDPYLEFYFYWSNEASTSYDEIWMEYSTDGGTSWQIVSPPAGNGGCYELNWYNYPDNWGGNVGGCFSGTGAPTNWVTVRKCISSLGGLPQVEFRFRISTGTQCNNYGATIDNWTICDASIEANATASCTGNFGEYDFNDWSYPCPDQWSWDFGDGNTSSLQFPQHTYSSPGTYTVTLTATSSAAVTSGCGTHTDTYTFSLTVYDETEISYSSATFCSSDQPSSPSIIGSTNGTFSSTPTGLSINPSNGEVTASTSTSGTYTITYVPSANCAPNATTTLTITESPTMNSYADLSVCSGDLVAFTPFQTQPSGLNTNWNVISGQNVGFGVSGSGNLPDFIANNGTGSPIAVDIEVTPVTTSGCTAIADTFSLVINPSPNSNFVADTLYGCSPLSVTFSSTSSNTSCLWDFGDGNTSTSCDQASHTFVSGEYDISYTVTSSVGCTSTTTYSNYIEATPTPIANFTYSPQLITTENSSLELTNTSINTDQVFWQLFGDNGLSQTSQSETVVVDLPATPATYTICLTATNSFGCETINCKDIEVQNELSFYIPNTFTPNNDGINDLFGPVFSGVIPAEYHLRIFNRWGQLIWESSDISETWDGKFNGKVVPENSYIWTLNYKEEGQLEYKKAKGHVNLIR